MGIGWTADNKDTYMSKGFQMIRPMTVNDAALTSSNVPETDCVLWAVSTTYAINTYVRYVTTNVHQVYIALVAITTSNYTIVPGTAAASGIWSLVSVTNRWAMFDGSVTSQTSNANSIADVFAASGRIDTVALLNVSASMVRITMTDMTDGVVYDTTTTLISTYGIVDWYAYFFEPIVRITDFAATDLPPYYNASIAVTLADTGNTVLCGACVLGLSKILGGTQYGAKVGIVDYSAKTLDAYGNYSIVKRAFSKRGTFTIWVDSGLVDQVQVLLAQYRSTPIVYIGADVYGATIFYGFYKDFDIDISYPTQAVCSIQIEGLT